MKITIAKTAGFCMGVRRAVDMVLDAANSSEGPICTYGPLIHNPQVLEMLRTKGIPSISKIPDKGEGIVLIRAHGVPPQDQEKLKSAGFKVINATCPRVIRVQTIIRKHAQKGFAAIIIGDRDHPEVQGLLGYAGDRGITASTMGELQALPVFEKAVIVAQTTQDTSLYDQVKKWVQSEQLNYKVYDTICDSTEKRQAEARRIARLCDAVVIVGGKQSGNTRRLAQIAGESGKPAMHVEDDAELDMELLSHAKSIAITAGASTPNWIISKTFRAIEGNLQNSNKALGPLLKLRDFLLRSNFLLAAGAGFLTYACSRLQGIDHNLIYSFISILYVLSMQIINNLFSTHSDQYNNPARAMFYEAHLWILTVIAMTSGSAGLFLAYKTGMLSFFMIAIMSLMGLSYNLNFFPIFIKNSKIKKIKDIPGSKTILIALAWGMVTTLVPAISNPGTHSFFTPFIFATGMVFARNSFFAIMEIQGDRITGKETLPILLGEKKSFQLIKIILCSVSITLLISKTIGITTATAIPLAFLPMLMLYIIISNMKKNIHPGMNLEFIIESHFLIAGAAAALF